MLPSEIEFIGLWSWESFEYLFGFSNDKLSLLHIEHKQTVQQNAYDQDPYAKEFGIKISEKLALVEARILPAPWVIYPKFSA